MYAILTIITLWSFFLYQKMVKKKPANYFSYLLLPVLCYSVTYGFRKGWGRDYIAYDSLFTGTGRLDIDSYEWLFRHIVTILRTISDSSALLFVLIAALTVFSYILLLKDHKNVIGLSLSLFYLFSAYQVSNLVRYFMAVSLVTIGVYFALNNKWGYTLIVWLTAIFIHLGVGVLLVMFIPFFYYNPFKNLRINLILYIITLVASLESVRNTFSGYILKVLTSFNWGNLQLVKYADRDVINNYILGNTFENVTVSIYYRAFDMIYGLLFIILGHKLVSLYPKIKNVCFFYNIGVFGILFFNIAQETEILYRIAIVFIYLSSVIVAYILRYSRKLKIAPLLLVAFALSVIYKCFFSLKSIYNFFDVKYIWN